MSFILIRKLVLLAIGVWFVVGAVTAVMTPPSPARGTVAKAKADVHVMGECASMFAAVRGRWPTLAELTTPDADGRVLLESIGTDPWGHEYVLTRGAVRKTMEARCLGPDGTHGTADDIVVKIR